MNEIDVYEFITNKQLSIRAEFERLHEEEESLKAEFERKMQEIKNRRKELTLETYVYDNYDGSELVKITTTTTTVSIRGHMPNGTKMRLQDSIRKIFDIKGTGMRIKALRSELEKMEYHFSSYSSAYGILTELDYLEKVHRGYYQYRKSYE